MKHPHLRALNLNHITTRRVATKILTRQGYIAGTVRIEGAPARCRVRCIERQTGRLVAETWSSDQGQYRFDYLEIHRRYQVVAMDYQLQYNAVIADNVGPVPGDPAPTDPEETLLAALRVGVTTVDGVVTVFWRNPNLTQDEVRLYRSSAPMPPSSLPPPAATLAAFATQYSDTAADPDADSYYRIGVVRGATEVISEEVRFDPDLAGGIIGVALINSSVQGGELAHIDSTGSIIASPPPAYFDQHPCWNLTEEVVDGQHMINVPKCYFRRERITVPPYAGLKDCWWISSTPQPGFTLFPAFAAEAGELSHFQYGKYEGYVTGGKLCSLPGVTPTAARSWTTFQSDATARNVGGVTGFRMCHIDMRAVIQWLYLIEHASFDSQETTAEGYVFGSGSALVTDHAANLAASYRGIVGLWGNHSEWIDGIRTAGGFIERRPHFSDEWAPTGVPIPNNGDSHQAVTLLPGAPVADLFIADEFDPVDDGLGSTIPDAARFGTGTNYPLAGGRRTDGLRAGLWYLFVDNTATYTNTTFGSRLARVP